MELKTVRKTEKSLVQEAPHYILKTVSKEDGLNEIKYNKIFSKNFNVPKIFEYSIKNDNMIIKMEKVPKRDALMFADRKLLGKKFAEVALSYTMITNTKSLLDMFDNHYKVYFGKRIYSELKNKLFKSKITTLGLTHGDITNNIIGNSKKQYLIDFETVRFREIEHELAILKYIYSNWFSRDIAKHFGKHFSCNKDRLRFYAILLLNEKLFGKEHPATQFKKCFSFDPRYSFWNLAVYFFRLMHVLLFK
ncbi:hypothetical protein H6503_01645 [Candidatus Woesearchaeota archaeon]|nr:hypothetical protein [Candidatus Woesearchaeota archaeon]